MLLWRSDMQTWLPPVMSSAEAMLKDLLQVGILLKVINNSWLAHAVRARP